MTGDLETGNDLWPVVVRQIEIALRQFGPNMIYDMQKKPLYWLVFDWKEGYDRQASMQGLAIWSIQNSYELAKLLGKENDVSSWLSLIKKMKEAIKYFIGTHDFTTFTCAEDKRTDKIRTIKDANIFEKDGILSITFLGNGFLKYQVRNMVGLLIRVGDEKISTDVIPSFFERKDRREIGLTAPASGLTLLKVTYE